MPQQKQPENAAQTGAKATDDLPRVEGRPVEKGEDGERLAWPEILLREYQELGFLGQQEREDLLKDNLVADYEALLEAENGDERRNIFRRFWGKIAAKADKPNQTRAALCLSGGGIRSATFNLGVLQGLARAGLLKEMDYLSTVSGGGFIGSWLTLWKYRRANELDGQSGPAVMAELEKPGGEPEEIRYLRRFRNYITPDMGVLTTDTWAFLTVVLRNILLNWLSLVPALMAALLLPAISYAASDWLTAQGWAAAFGAVGLVAGFAGMCLIFTNLPSVGNDNYAGERVGIGRLLLLFFALSAIMFSLYWYAGGRVAWQSVSPVGAALGAMWELPIFGALATVTAFLVGLGWKKERNPKTANVLLTVFFTLLAGALMGGIFYGATYWGQQMLASWTGKEDYKILYSGLSVPLIMVLFWLGGTFIAGLASRWFKPEDQEWWARCGAYMLRLALLWPIIWGVVFYGPIFVSSLSLRLSPSTAATVVGVISGAFSLVSGFSSSTAGSNEQSNKGSLLNYAATLGALAATILILAFLAGLNRKILNALWGGGPVSFLEPQHLPLMLILFSALALFAWLMSGLINTNRFSLHYYWRNRIVRAYHGASRKDRAARANKFTDFAEGDTAPMSDLQQNFSKPLHIINIALNLVGSKRADDKFRRCESFTVSPFHCGSRKLGYRSSAQYAKSSISGGNDGITLGTAVAISGAAVSPNMGYMMSSPAIRFLMTFFNVRLGFWLGNPGKAGEEGRFKTYNRDSPRFSLRTIIEEALGMTTDTSPYVYLSDGGHFDNLGLYEMVARRCRLIIVSDATTDAAYKFDDLNSAIQLIGRDFGVSVEGLNASSKLAFNRDGKAGNVYYAVAKLIYPGAAPGLLIYFKPSLRGEEPFKVFAYNKENPAFPQDSIADQWFSEAQFEAYRALGKHIVETTCREAHANGKPTIKELQHWVSGKLNPAKDAGALLSALEFGP